MKIEQSRQKDRRCIHWQPARRQPQAVDRFLEHDIGVLSGTTAFGKTVVAIRLIAERKVNTLIIVDRASLIRQWKNKLSEFLAINDTCPYRTEV